MIPTSFFRQYIVVVAVGDGGGGGGCLLCPQNLDTLKKGKPKVTPISVLQDLTGQLETQATKKCNTQRKGDTVMLIFKGLLPKCPFSCTPLAL